VIKASELTPFSTLYFAHLCSLVGFPNGVVNVVPGDEHVGRAIVENSGVKLVSFTGSTQVGRHISVGCAKRFIPCALELGGE
jgi:aldehyde dehydrogenase (NAD+)